MSKNKEPETSIQQGGVEETETPTTGHKQIQSLALFKVASFLSPVSTSLPKHQPFLYLPCSCHYGHFHQLSNSVVL